MKILLAIVIALSGVGCSRIHTIPSEEKQSGIVAVLRGEYRESVKESDTYNQRVLKTVLVTNLNGQKFNTRIIQPLILSIELNTGSYDIEINCRYESRRYPRRRRLSRYKRTYFAEHQMELKVDAGINYQIMCDRTLDKDNIWIEAIEPGVIDR